MARYADIDTILNELPDDLPYKASVKRVLMQAPEANVVPRFEAENYKSIAEHQQKLSIERYFEIKQLKQELDKAKGKVEYLQSELDVCEMILDIPKLKQEIETLKDTNEHLAVMLAEAKAEVAEVLDKLDRFINANCIRIKDERGIKGYATSGVHFAIAELKKKYTEGE